LSEVCDGVLPTTADVSGLPVRRDRHRGRQRVGPALQLRDLPSPVAGVHPTVRPGGGRTGRGATDVTNLVGVDPDPETLPLDLELQVVFEEIGDVTLPLFTPAVVR
jgi:hypothetical protein